MVYGGYSFLLVWVTTGGGPGWVRSRVPCWRGVELNDFAAGLAVSTQSPSGKLWARGGFFGRQGV